MMIGREQERACLLSLLQKDESQFCVVYGRRRVGKTFLIRETFNYQFAFQHTGIAGADKKQQLTAFRNSLQTSGMGRKPVPKDWFEAFQLLEEFLDTLPTGKKVVFIDELAWMDTKRSNLVSALEYFWNAWATARRQKDIILIVCASASSWITKKIFMNRGGLHNRATARIYVSPFTLSQCEQFAQVQSLRMSRQDIVDTYMIMGGIPYYWNYLQPNFSLAQNIDNIFFHPDAPLKNEYQELYHSLFQNASAYMKVVAALGTKKAGMTRDEIVHAAGLDNSGDLTDVLHDLEICDFIQTYQNFGKNKYGLIYQLIDNFTLFYFQFVEHNHKHNPAFWTDSLSTPRHNTWAGLAYERVCLLHTNQIKRALGISGVSTSISSWQTKANEEHEGAQIDLLIEREDNVINLCEIKYSNSEYVIGKEEDMKMRNKVGLFKSLTKTRKAVHLTYITTYGLKRNMYEGNILHQLDMDDLFE